MSTKSAIKEITPLTQNDCFTMFTRVKKEFDFPLHYHDEYELNLIINAKGAKRIVGTSVEVIDDLELVLVGPNLSHAWFTYQCTSEEITEITIQWHKDLFDERLLKRNQMSFIQGMFNRSSRGILFNRETIQALVPRIISLKHCSGFDSVMELFSILHDLSISRNMTTLSEAVYNTNPQANFNSRRLERVFAYIQQNYPQQIFLKDVAKMVNMTDVSFSRFIKKRTGVSFVDSLNEVRLGHACRMLIDSTHSVSEICYKCGFNNLSNFNRLFKKKKNCTPKEFRENYAGTRIFV